MTAAELTNWVNGYLGMEGDDCYKVRTVTGWLHILGFKVKETTKGIFMDGHERANVVKDRQERFLPTWRHFVDRSVWSQQEEDGSYTLIREDSPYILVSVDQKAHSSYDIQHMYVLYITVH